MLFRSNSESFFCNETLWEQMFIVAFQRYNNIHNITNKNYVKNKQQNNYYNNLIVICLYNLM